MPDPSIAAIEAAREGNWEKAIKINLAILAQNEVDVDAYNRLAHAYTELGKVSLAKRAYHRVLILDPYNPLAQKKLKKLNDLKEGQVPVTSNNNAATSCFFLEEPGKTKVVTLVNPAPASVILTLSPGEPVDLIFKKHQVVVVKAKNYLGALPDDLAHRLIHLTRLGNKYEASVLSVERNNLQIFLQETKRGKRLGNHPSFPSQGIGDYYPSVRKGSVELGKEVSDFYSGEEAEEAPEGEQE